MPDPSTRELLDSFFTAIAASGGAFSAWVAWGALRDQKQGRLDAGRAEYYRRMVFDPVLEITRAFVKAAVPLIRHAAGAARSIEAELWPEDKIAAAERSLVDEYDRLYEEMSRPVLTAAAAFDSRLHDRLERRVELLEDLEEHFHRVVNPAFDDPLIDERVEELVGKVWEVVISWDCSVPKPPSVRDRAAILFRWRR